jgi:hydroxyacid-oxoacid transhydrogenase
MMREYAFEMATSAIRFGFGVTRELGAELADLNKQHVLVFTDPSLRALPPARIPRGAQDPLCGF